MKLVFYDEREKKPYIYFQKHLFVNPGFVQSFQHFSERRSLFLKGVKIKNSYSFLKIIKLNTENKVIIKRKAMKTLCESYMLYMKDL